MSFRFAELVGTYRLVVSDALLEFIERAFVARTPHRERERVRKEALDEAKRSELRIDPDGTITSRSGESEFYRVKVAFEDVDFHSLSFEKSPAFMARGTVVRLQPASDFWLWKRSFTP